jgi:nuclear transport factor 2 (NTF2) superfamily protein
MLEVPAYLYRYRSIYALLGEDRLELDTQTIYFADQNQLNDPVEGFRDIVWCGDEIVWENLIRHYLLNLFQAVSLACLGGNTFKATDCEGWIFGIPSDLPDAPIRSVFREFEVDVLKQIAIKQIVTYLGSSQRRVRSDELKLYLYFIHSLVISILFEVLKRYRLMPEEAFPVNEIENKNSINGLQALTQALPKMESNHLEDFASMAKTMLEQMRLIDSSHWGLEHANAQWIFVIRDFTSFYVDALPKLIHRPWYAACFSATSSNSSMWGTYGDSHHGVCLKFKPQILNNRPVIDLLTITSWGGSKDDFRVNRSYESHSFMPIDYSGAFPEIDFFESMGALPRYKLSEFWFLGHDGKRSSIALRMLSENEEWRTEYWEKFAKSHSCKTNDWSHEQEYRLVLHSLFLDTYNDASNRKLQYKFGDLAGIVFGINTSEKDKVDLMRIIDKKCQEEQRTDFEFEQARYSNATKKIEVVPYRLLQINRDKS